MGAVTIEEADGATSIVSPSCRLVFHRLGESWAHSIEIGRGRATFARSIEPDPDRDDSRNVASPTYQDLHLQADGDDWLALLVGQFGTRQYSASFRVSLRHRDRADVEPTTKIHVDVADRCRDPGRVMRSSYEVLAPPRSFNARSSAPLNAVWEHSLPGGSGPWSICGSSTAIARMPRSRSRTPAPWATSPGSNAP